MNNYTSELLKGVYDWVKSKKQDVLVSGTNIKTINGETLLGEGDIEVKGSSGTMFPNVTIFGQPTIQETQISGFSSSNYLQFPFLVDFAGRHWEIDFSFTTSNNITSQQNILDSSFGLALAIRNSKMVIAMSTNGTTWDLGETTSIKSIETNKTYKAHLSFDGTKYEVSLSINDGVSYENYITVNSSGSLAPKQIIIGTTTVGTSSFLGSINLADAKLTISEKVVWEGMAEVGTATRLAIDLSNIDEAGKEKIKEISGVKLIDLLNIDV